MKGEVRGQEQCNMTNAKCKSQNVPGNGVC
jgi:hypothetical protein